MLENTGNEMSTSLSNCLHSFLRILRQRGFQLMQLVSSKVIYDSIGSLITAAGGHFGIVGFFCHYDKFRTWHWVYSASTDFWKAFMIQRTNDKTTQIDSAEFYSYWSWSCSNICLTTLWLLAALTTTTTTTWSLSSWPFRPRIAPPRSACGRRCTRGLRRPPWQWRCRGGLGSDRGDTLGPGGHWTQRV